jgi:hypothetical protein
VRTLWNIADFLILDAEFSDKFMIVLSTSLAHSSVHYASGVRTVIFGTLN